MVPAQSQFPVTRWTLLQTLREGSSDEARIALEALCRAYWFPLYVVARKRLSEFDAEDAVQGFFLSLLERDSLNQADASRGKLRTFLRTAFENYCNRQWQQQNSQRRGGRVEHLDLLLVNGAETRYIKHAEGSADDIATLYNREWARAVLEASLEVLRAEYAARGQEARFNLLAKHLSQADMESCVEQSAAALSMTGETFRVALHRIRKQYKNQIQCELARTMDTTDPALIREELHELFRVFS